MKRTRRLLYLAASACMAMALVTSSVQSAPIIYPAKGQDAAQQNKDEGECRQWAVNNTGVDPAQLAGEANSGEVYQRHHTALGGAARGAIGGLLVGAIAGDAGKGAAIGAGVGAVGGGIRGRRDLSMQYQVAENAHAAQQAQLQQYDRAYDACLSGRGYTVK
jgi:hypothetical protein